MRVAPGVGGVDGLLDLLPVAMVIAVAAVGLGLFAIVGALLTITVGSGASTPHEYSNRFGMHDRWVREHLRRRYLIERGIVADPARGAYVPYAPDPWDMAATDRAAWRGPVRIGPSLTATASAGRGAFLGSRPSRGPRASGSGRRRRLARSSTSALPRR